MYYSFCDFDVYNEILETYRKLRAQYSVLDAEHMIREGYKDYFDDSDDAAMASVALSKAQIRRKELTQNTAARASEALEMIREEKEHFRLSKRDLDKLQMQLEDSANYIDVETAMKVPPEKKPRRPFQLDWRYGDVYAFVMSSHDAKEAGLAGKLCLLRVVDFKDPASEKTERTCPICYISIWEGDALPQSAEEIRDAGLLRMRANTIYYVHDPELHAHMKAGNASNEEMCAAGALKIFSHCDKTKYRAIIDIPSKRALNSFGVKFVGNYPELGIAADDAGLDLQMEPAANLNGLQKWISGIYIRYPVLHPEMLIPHESKGK